MARKDGIIHIITPRNKAKSKPGPERMRRFEGVLRCYVKFKVGQTEDPIMALKAMVEANRKTLNSLKLLGLYSFEIQGSYGSCISERDIRRI